MSPINSADDSELLANTLRSYTERWQVDAKMKLPLMSRRKFSDMFREINGIQSLLEKLNIDKFTSYKTLFQYLMGYNDSFTKVWKIPALFYKSEYAEQWYNKYLNYADFSDMLDCLDDAFRKSFAKIFPNKKTIEANANNKILKILLKNGIISPVMIRNLKKEKFCVLPMLLQQQSRPDYYQLVLDSIENPINDIFIIGMTRAKAAHAQLSVSDKAVNLNDVFSNNKQPIPIHQVKCKKRDLLSPPTLLSNSDSMGKYNELHTCSANVFGEAIIEIRSIRYVGSYFLKQIGCVDAFFEFLHHPENILDHATGLFDFLFYFPERNSDDTIKEIINDLYERNNLL
jgi:hypothetical protein